MCVCIYIYIYIYIYMYMYMYMYMYGDLCTRLLRICTYEYFVLQTFQLQMMSPSGNTVPPNNSGSVTQVINIANPQKVRCMLPWQQSSPLVLTHYSPSHHDMISLQQPLRMRIRLGYHANGVDVQEQGEINDFPPQLVQ